MSLFSAISNFSQSQIGDAINCIKTVQLDDPTITQFLATQYGCANQNNLGQFSLTRLQNRTEAPTVIDYSRLFASVFIRAKRKRIKHFRFSATFQKTCVFCAQGAHDKFHRHNRRDWHFNSMPPTKELESNENTIYVEEPDGR